MHHSIKDHHLFGCTKHIIKLELWFVCVREHTLYGFFHKLSTKKWCEDLSWCRLLNNCNYVQKHLEMVLLVLLAHKVKNHIFYKFSSCAPTFPSFLFMFGEFGVCFLCFASLCWKFKKIQQVFLTKEIQGLRF